MPFLATFLQNPSVSSEVSLVRTINERKRHSLFTVCQCLYSLQYSSPGSGWLCNKFNFVIQFQLLRHQFILKKKINKNLKATSYRMKQKISINAIDKTFNSLYDIRGKYPCTMHIYVKICVYLVSRCVLDYLLLGYSFHLSFSLVCSEKR